MRIALLALALTVPACPPSPTPPNPDGGSCENACTSLAAAGCPEGTDSKCVPTCQHVEAAHLTDLHLSCLSSAKTKDDARKCGTRCQP